MADKIQLRRDSSANWTSVNPILSQGEPGYENDTGKIKYGDGVTAWSSLPYASGGGGGNGYQGGWNYSANADADPSWADGEWGESIGGRGAPGDSNYVSPDVLIFKTASGFYYR